MTSNPIVSSAGRVETVQAQAGPIPTKIGEIGYGEGTVDRPTDQSATDAANGDLQPLSTVPLTPAATTTHNRPARPGSSRSEATTTSKQNERLIWSRLIFAGFRLDTFLLFLLQLFILLSVIAGWVVSAIVLSQVESPVGGAVLFFHIAFALLVILQLVFVERRVYRLRVERYTFLHPGSLPPGFCSRGFPPGLAFGPWNRPPLPTYAAALLETGLCTGDVEDVLISVPPPPAYGHTRGSTMLLSGHLPESLRAQRPVSGRSHDGEVTPGERPLSYVSRDDEWAEIQNAERARRLEETLARLSPSESRS